MGVRPILVLLGTLAVVTAACDGSETPSEVVPSAPSPADRARAVADAALPAESDLPAGWVPGTDAPPPDGTEQCGHGEPEPAATAQLDRRDPVAGVPSIRVAAAVHDDVAGARDAWRARAATQWFECLVEALAGGGEALELVRPTVERFEPGRLGDESTGARIEGEARGPDGATIDARVEVVVLRAGTVVVTATLTSATAFPLADDDRASILASVARAAVAAEGAA